MTKKYTKAEFMNLDLDSKCVIIEHFLSEEYFQGQTDINFYVSPDYTGNEEFLPETPPEIKKVEDKKFNTLIDRLTDKLFSLNETIEFDLLNC